MKTPLSYHGGKQNLVATTLPLFPPHQLYCEPFIGGGAEFWAKKPSYIECINDLNDEIVNLYQVVVKDFDALALEIQATPHSRALHALAAKIYKNPAAHTPVQRAWAVWVQCNMSFANGIGSGWRYAREQVEAQLNYFHKTNFTKALNLRLKHVEIECSDALKIIKSRDRKDGQSFFRCDPPYFNSDMGHYKGYTEADFIALLDTLAAIKGKFLLSCYPSPILNEYIAKNHWHEFVKIQNSNVPNVADGRAVKQKTEMLVANYDFKNLNCGLFKK